IGSGTKGMGIVGPLIGFEIYGRWAHRPTPKTPRETAIDFVVVVRAAEYADYRRLPGRMTVLIRTCDRSGSTSTHTGAANHRIVDEVRIGIHECRVCLRELHWISDKSGETLCRLNVIQLGENADEVRLDVRSLVYDVRIDDIASQQLKVIGMS